MTLPTPKETLSWSGERKQIARPSNGDIYIVDSYLIGHWTAICYSKTREVFGSGFRTANEAKDACEKHFNA